VQLDLGRPETETASAEDVAERSPERGVIITVPIKEPAPGVFIILIPLPYGAFIPEKIVNPEAESAPDMFSELHRSALEELAGQAWQSVSGEFSKRLGRPFKTGSPEVALDSIGNYLTHLPAMMGIDSLFFVEYPARISRETFSMFLIVPSNFLEALFPQASARETVKVKAPEAGDGRTLTALEVPFIEAGGAARKISAKTKSAKPAGKGAGKITGKSRNLQTLLDIPVDLTVEIGKANVTAEKIMNLAPGSVVGLDVENGKPIRILVNERVIALGQVVTIGDKFGVMVVEMVEPEKRLERY